LAQIGQGAFDGPPTSRLEVFVSLARLATKPISSLKSTQSDLKSRRKGKLGSDEKTPQNVIRVPLLSFRHVEAHPRVWGEKFDRDHTKIFISMIMLPANQRQFPPQLVWQKLHFPVLSRCFGDSRIRHKRQPSCQIPALRYTAHTNSLSSNPSPSMIYKRKRKRSRERFASPKIPAQPAPAPAIQRASCSGFRLRRRAARGRATRLHDDRAADLLLRDGRTQWRNCAPSTPHAVECGWRRRAASVR
jgi:hypothetical protein